MVEGFKLGKRSHEQELDMTSPRVQLLVLESICGPSYDMKAADPHGHACAPYQRFHAYAADTSQVLLHIHLC